MLRTGWVAGAAEDVSALVGLDRQRGFRDQDRPLLIWVDDAEQKRVNVVEVGRIFDDMLRSSGARAA